MSSPDATQRLAQFFGAYFHEDWDLDARDTDSVVDKYCSQQSGPQGPAMLADDISSLVASDLSEQALQTMLFDNLGCYYDPSADGLSARLWLQAVAARLEEGGSRRTK